MRRVHTEGLVRLLSRKHPSRLIEVSRHASESRLRVVVLAALSCRRDPPLHCCVVFVFASTPYVCITAVLSPPPPPASRNEAGCDSVPCSGQLGSPRARTGAPRGRPSLGEQYTAALALAVFRIPVFYTLHFSSRLFKTCISILGSRQAQQTRGGGGGRSEVPRRGLDRSQLVVVVFFMPFDLYSFWRFVSSTYSLHVVGFFANLSRVYPCLFRLVRGAGQTGLGG